MQSEQTPMDKGEAFTPGPWDAEEGIGGRSCDWQIYPPHALRDDTPLADAYSEANARLIAAAPEMYAALKEIVHFEADQLSRGEFLSLAADDEMFARARAALIKAQGGRDE